MTTSDPTPTNQQSEQPSTELDFDSDEPLPVCPMRKDGMGDDEICEACQ
jgi:hypothetical protein